MKKSITLISILVTYLLAMSIVSCEEPRGNKAPKSSRMELDSTSQYYDQNYKIYTLEGCEYVVVGVGDCKWGSHKGNCKNPIHYNDVDTSFTEEKHFDCTVEECTKEKDGTYAITTECGILFYTEKKKNVGDILKGFKSPKHK
jgi:hypothetical protein